MMERSAIKMKWLLAVMPVSCFLLVMLMLEISIGLPLHYPPDMNIGGSVFNAQSDENALTTEREVIDAIEISLRSPQGQRELDRIIRYSRWNPRGLTLYLALTPILAMVLFSAARRKWQNVAILGVGIIAMFIFSEVFVVIAALGFGSVGLIAGLVCARSTVLRRG